MFQNMAKKKKYSNSTKEAARLYGKTKGWKKLSQKRLKLFIDSVSLATGYINKTSINKYAETSYQVFKIDSKKIIEAAKLWAQNNFPEWDRLSKDRLNIFKNEFENWSKLNNLEPTSDNALEFAKESFNIEVDEFEEEETISEPIYIVENMPAFSDTDVLDDFMRMDNFFEVRLVDVDNFVLHIGNDRSEFWDVFRGLTEGGQFPIYDAFYQEDIYGNIFLTVKIIGYYP